MTKYPITSFYYNYSLRFFIRSIEGEENLPKQGFIAAANHASYIDDFLLPYVTIRKRTKRFLIFVNSRFYKNFFTRKFLEIYDTIPVDVRKDVRDEEQRKRTNEKAFQKAIQILKKGDIFLIFPEGGRSKNGKLKKAKTGIARIALESRAPVIPIGFEGTHGIMPKGAILPRLKRCDVKIGKPLTFQNFYGRKDKKVYDEVTRIIMKEIARLSNQAYEF